MELIIDGRRIEALTGQRLKGLVDILNLDSAKLSERPIAAKIAGEVYTLNYVPVREDQRIRRAMSASGGSVNLLHYNDPAGKHCLMDAPVRKLIL